MSVYKTNYHDYFPMTQFYDLMMAYMGLKCVKMPKTSYSDGVCPSSNCPQDNVLSYEMETFKR